MRLMKSPMAPPALKSMEASDQLGAFRTWVASGGDSTSVVQMLVEKKSRGTERQV